MKIIIVKQGIQGKGLTIDNNGERPVITCGKDILKENVDYSVEGVEDKETTELTVPWSEFPIIFKQRRG